MTASDALTMLVPPRHPSGRPARLILGSASPRRSAMLRELGIDAAPCAPELDDGALRGDGRPPRQWAMAMAWFKAAQVARSLLRQRPASEGDAPPLLLLAADTICDLDGRIVGKPRDEQECAAVLEAFARRSHLVHTGFCLLTLGGGSATGRRWIGADSAEVQLGDLNRAEIDRYVHTGMWKDKAGGYSFTERLEAGWPLRCIGDPATVMGLPLRRLGPRLRAMVAGERGDPPDIADRSSANDAPGRGATAS